MTKIALTNANLIDVVGDRGGLGTLVIVDERIEAITPGEATHLDADAQVYDLAGRSVMPGMISCHYHATYPGLPLAAKLLPIGMESPQTVQTLQAVRNKRLALAIQLH
jgi:imidazolonepropionase-like amidohydrolase